MGVKQALSGGWSVLALVLGAMSCMIVLSQAVPTDRLSKRFESNWGTNNTFSSQDSCSSGNKLYKSGETVPDNGGPCEECICKPPNIQCAMITCPVKTGCKIIQLPNQCCPQFLCDCEFKGRNYFNGEQIETQLDKPCEKCYCKGGDVMCTSVTCYERSDCQAIVVTGQCCPKYENCPPRGVKELGHPEKTEGSLEIDSKTKKREMQPWLLTNPAGEAEKHGTTEMNVQTAVPDDVTSAPTNEEKTTVTSSLQKNYSDNPSTGYRILGGNTYDTTVADISSSDFDFKSNTTSYFDTTEAYENITQLAKDDLRENEDLGNDTLATTTSDEPSILATNSPTNLERSTAEFRNEGTTNSFTAVVLDQTTELVTSTGVLKEQESFKAADVKQSNSSNDEGESSEDLASTTLALTKLEVTTLEIESMRQEAIPTTIPPESSKVEDPTSQASPPEGSKMEDSTSQASPSENSKVKDPTSQASPSEASKVEDPTSQASPPEASKVEDSTSQASPTEASKVEDLTTQASLAMVNQDFKNLNAAVSNDETDMNLSRQENETIVSTEAEPIVTTENLEDRVKYTTVKDDLVKKEDEEERKETDEPITPTETPTVTTPQTENESYKVFLSVSQVEEKATVESLKEEESKISVQTESPDVLTTDVEGLSTDVNERKELTTIRPDEETVTDGVNDKLKHVEQEDVTKAIATTESIEETKLMSDEAQNSTNVGVKIPDNELKTGEKISEQEKLSTTIEDSTQFMSDGTTECIVPDKIIGELVKSVHNAKESESKTEMAQVVGISQVDRNEVKSDAPDSISETQLPTTTDGPKDQKDVVTMAKIESLTADQTTPRNDESDEKSKSEGLATTTYSDLTTESEKMADSVVKLVASSTMPDYESGKEVASTQVLQDIEVTTLRNLGTEKEVITTETLSTLKGNMVGFNKNTFLDAQLSDDRNAMGSVDTKSEVKTTTEVDTASELPTTYGSVKDFKTEQVTVGLANYSANGAGVTEAVSAGVTEAVKADVTEAVKGGVTEAVSAGVTEAAKAGVTEAVSAGVTEAVKAGVTEAVKAGGTEAVSSGVTKIEETSTLPSEEFALTEDPKLVQSILNLALSMQTPNDNLMGIHPPSFIPIKYVGQTDGAVLQNDSNKSTELSRSTTPIDKKTFTIFNTDKAEGTTENFGDTKIVEQLITKHVENLTQIALTPVANKLLDLVDKTNGTDDKKTENTQGEIILPKDSEIEKIAEQIRNATIQSFQGSFESLEEQLGEDQTNTTKAPKLTSQPVKHKREHRPVSHKIRRRRIKVKTKK